MLHESTKWCGFCRVSHPLAAFGNDVRQKDGLARYCRESRKDKTAAQERKRMALDTRVKTATRLASKIQRKTAELLLLVDQLKALVKP